MLCLLLTLLSSAPIAHAAPMKIFEEGSYRGVRIMLPCSLGTPDGYCFVDTAGSGSILREAPAGGQVIKPSEMTGIGWSMKCETSLLSSFHLAGQAIANFEYELCPQFSEFFSPSLGMNIFWGKRFAFDFAANEFHWLDSLPAEGTFPIRRGGSLGRWILMDASLNGAGFTLAWDTGAPITLVTPEFVASQPALFEEETTLTLPGSLRRTGGKGYRIKAPIVVNGVNLNGLYVHAVDLKKFFGDKVAGLPVILGTDHLRRARWSFDLVDGRGRVEAIENAGPVGEGR